MWWHKSHLALVMLIAMSVCGTSRALLAEWKIGESLPDLASFELEGKLPDKLKGQVILLDFWASWCAPCKVSFPAMDQLQKDFAQRGLVIIAVSVDDKAQAMEKFLKSNPVTFHALRDARQKLVASADVSTMPSSFLVDRAGTVRFVHGGFHGDKTIKQYREEIESLLKEQAL